MDTHTSSEELTKEMTDLLFKQSDRHEECLEKYYDAYPNKQDEAEAPAWKATKTGKATIRKTWSSLHNAKILG